MPDHDAAGTGLPRFPVHDLSAWFGAPDDYTGRHRCGAHRGAEDEWFVRAALGASAVLGRVATYRWRLAHVLTTAAVVVAATGVVQGPAAAHSVYSSDSFERAIAAALATASRDAARGVGAEEPEPEDAEERPAAEPEKEPAEKPDDDDIAPVGGLDETQMANAVTIVRVGQDMGLPKRAWIIAVMTAIQESSLYNVASPVVPESYDYPHEGEGWDHDSIGLFQQRASGDWGTVEEIMDPATSARAFYNGLKGVWGWEDMELTVAAQSVQVSAFPYAYAKHESLARDIVRAAG